MNDNRYMELGESFKTTFDVLFGPGPYELDFISVAATGEIFTMDGEEKWAEVLRIERLTFHADGTAALCMTPNEDSWYLSCMNALDATEGYLPIEESDHLMIWVVSELTEAYAADIFELFDEIEKGSPRGWGKESMDLALRNWWQLTKILKDFAEGKWAEFDPNPNSKLAEKAYLGLTRQVRNINDWKDRGLQQYTAHSEYFVTALLHITLPELEGVLDGFREEQERAPYIASGKSGLKESLGAESSSLPNPQSQVAPNQYVKKQGLSTNAMAWVVALAVGAFIAIGAALGY